jgi:GNAT superfamily N-acetyltransferase
MITLRPVDDNNREAVAMLFHDTWHETQAPLQNPLKAKYRGLEFFLERMKGRAETVAAYDGDRLAGFVSWTGASLNSLFVHPDFRNHNVGLILLQHAEKTMFAAGHAELELDCVAGNTAARRFYEKHGWRLGRIDMHRQEKPEGIVMTELWMMVKP